MINLQKLLVVLIILLFSTNSLRANDRSAIINIDYIVQNSNIGKKTLNNINNLDKKNIEKFKKKNKELKELETNIRNKKNIISEDDFQKEVVSFQEKIKLFTSEKDKTVNNFQNYRKEELQKLFNLFKPIISNYIKENSINILIDSKNIFMANEDANITNEILIIINKELK